MDDITQEQVDKMVEACRNEWNDLVKASGVDRSVFIAMSTVARQYLTQYEDVRVEAISRGFDVPELVSGISVTIIESENE